MVKPVASLHALLLNLVAFPHIPYRMVDAGNRAAVFTKTTRSVESLPDWLAKFHVACCRVRLCSIKHILACRPKSKPPKYR